MRAPRVTGIGVLLFVLCFANSTDLNAGEIVTPPPAATPEKVKSSPEVKFCDGLLSATAKEADLRRLLEVIGEEAGVMFHIDPAVKGEVSVEFAGKSLQEALGVILGQVDGNNLLTGYDRDEKVKEIWVLPKGANAPAADEDLRLRRFNEEDKKYFKEKYGSLTRAVWEVFGKIYGKGRWDTREWNPAFDRPPTLSGMWTLEGDVLKSEESALDFGLSFIETYENLLQTRTEDLRINPRLTERGLNGYRFVFNQYLSDVPVEDGRVGFSVATKGFSLSNFTLPDVNVSPVPKLTSEEATAVALGIHKKTFRAWKDRYGEADANSFEEVSEEQRLPQGSTTLIVLPVGSPTDSAPDKYTSYAYHLAYKVHFVVQDYYIDAQAGTLLRTANNIKELTGTVTGMVYSDNTESNPLKRGLARLNVRLNGTAISGHTTEGPPATAIAGQYEYASPTDTASFELESTYSGARDFVVVDKANNRLSISNLGDSEFGVDAQFGFRPNVFYWADKAFDWFSSNLQTNINVNMATGTRGQTKIATFVNLAGGCTLGETGNNLSVKFNDGSGTCNGNMGSVHADVILHEMSHAAAYAKRGEWISLPKETAGLEEGIADYFACRIADNVDFFSGAGSSGNFNIDPEGTEEAKPKEHIGAGVLDDRDWQHYGNGSVIASTLWDLTKSVATDSVLWDSITSDRLMFYSPENLYDAVFAVATDQWTYGMDDHQIGTHIWNTFRAHSMNLWARPNSAGGVLVDWFPHRSPNYQGYYVYRNTTGIFDESSAPVMDGGVPKLFPPETTSWADLGADSSLITYHYAVRAVTADGQTMSTFSNEALSKGEPYGGSLPVPPQSFTGLVKVIDGDPAVELSWSAGTSADVSEHVIERADDAGFTANRIEQHVPSAYSQTPDFGYFGERFGFAQGAKYYYRIKAVDLAGLSSPWVLMNPAYVIPQPNTLLAPEAPANLQNRDLPPVAVPLITRGRPLPLSSAAA